MFSLKGKTCVVTGAGKGLGRAICLARTLWAGRAAPPTSRPSRPT
jgi:NAD(P)-dependent dehydrogenase (short-subunit alcohol dehydrogenase family)